MVMAAVDRRGGRGHAGDDVRGVERRRRRQQLAVEVVRGRRGGHLLEQARHPVAADGVAEDGAVGVHPELPRLLLHPRPPVVLDLVVRPPWQVLRDPRPPVSPLGMELEDEELLLRREVAALDVRLEVVEPPQPAALAGPLQP